jgi:hypothetical protein
LSNYHCHDSNAKTLKFHRRQVSVSQASQIRGGELRQIFTAITFLLVFNFKVFSSLSNHSVSASYNTKTNSL